MQSSSIGEEVKPERNDAISAFRLNCETKVFTFQSCKSQLPLSYIVAVPISPPS